jgi:hypothetical protein
MLDVIECPKCKRTMHFSEWSPEGAAHCPTCGESLPAPGREAVGVSAEKSDCRAAAVNWMERPSVEEVTIRISLRDSMAWASQHIPPLPRPLRPVPLAPTPYARPSQRLPANMPCPQCRARVPLDAEYCCHCGELLDEEEELRWDEDEPFPPDRRDYEPHRGTLILVLGILGLVALPLGLPCGIAAWVLGQGDLKKMEAKIMDPAGRLNTSAGRICGIIGTVVCSVYGLFILGAFLA